MLIYLVTTIVILTYFKYRAEIKWVYEHNIRLLLPILLTRGTSPHKSHDDPTDPDDIISVRLYNAKEQRLATAHAHKNGMGSVKKARGK